MTNFSIVQKLILLVSIIVHKGIARVKISFNKLKQIRHPNILFYFASGYQANFFCASIFPTTDTESPAGRVSGQWKLWDHTHGKTYFIVLLY